MNLVFCSPALLSRGPTLFPLTPSSPSGLKVAKAGLPVQNGMVYAKAGDIRAEEAAGVLKTGDPSGFNLVDVMAWGSLGHAAGFALLALQSSDCLPCGFQ